MSDLVGSTKKASLAAVLFWAVTSFGMSVTTVRRQSAMIYLIFDCAYFGCGNSRALAYAFIGTEIVIAMIISRSPNLRNAWSN